MSNKRLDDIIGDLREWEHAVGVDMAREYTKGYDVGVMKSVETADPLKFYEGYHKCFLQFEPLIRSVWQDDFVNERISEVFGVDFVSWEHLRDHIEEGRPQEIPIVPGSSKDPPYEVGYAAGKIDGIKVGFADGYEDGYQDSMDGRPKN